MQQSNMPPAERDQYVPSGLTKFLWWLSTAEKELLINCTVDRNRYAIIGMSVLATWLFATLAWMYFFSTIVSNLLIAALLGIFMGGVILTIDRALIKGITQFNKTKIWPLLFRGLLAITIGTFMAQPALLYLFDKEVHVQIALDNTQRTKAHQQKTDSAFLPLKNELLKEKTILEQTITQRYNEVDAARNNYIAEADGTGGSKKTGISVIAKAKQQEYEKLDASYKELQLATAPKLHSVDSSLNQIQLQTEAQQKQFAALLNDGFLTRIEALQHLIKDNSTLSSRYYLLVLILVLIELMPVLAKTLLPSGPYEASLLQREQLEKDLITLSISKEKEWEELYHELSAEQDKALLQETFATAQPYRQQKLQETLQEWKTGNDSWSSVWNLLKRRLFMHK